MDTLKPPEPLRVVSGGALMVSPEVADRAARKARAEHELRVARAIAQPQGLGLLFAGLRPKGQR